MNRTEGFLSMCRDCPMMWRLQTGPAQDIIGTAQQRMRLYTPGMRIRKVFFHDELEILDRDGNLPMDHRTGLPSSTTVISYRSEPMRNRMPLSYDPVTSQFYDWENRVLQESK